MVGIRKKYRIHEVIIVVLAILLLVSVIIDAYRGKKIEVQETKINDLTEIHIDLYSDIAEKSAANEKLIQELDELSLQIASLNSELEVTTKELAEYKERSAKYFSNNYNLMDYELEILYKIVEAEATGGDTSSKINVSHVIFNRVKSERFPDTITEVVFQKNAFSPVYDQRYFNVKVTENTKEAVNAALNGLDTTDGSTFFMYRADSESENSSWFDRKLEYVMTDSIGHEFFKLK